ncbi:alginate export family protein [Pseudomonas abieticivorans]|uniref:alginate export family protein n=1 Tax=Pseudomonas abieticivorans TaxID=2931382 RepID=UPI0020BFD0B1|nr:alginate export family protein [Pseudomonas sp. PIA16]
MNNYLKWLACCTLVNCSANAHELYNGENGSLNLNLELTVAPLYSSFDYGAHTDQNVKWMEGYIRGGLSGTTPVLGGTAYATVSVITSKVFGDGDAAGTSNGHESNTVTDNAFAGWKNDWLDLSAGRQSYTMGDSFLIAGDRLAYGDKIGGGMSRGGMYYLAQPTSFSQTAIARVRPDDHVLIEAFHLESNNDGQGAPILNGVNAEYTVSPGNSVGAAYIKVDNVDLKRAGGFFALRKDLNVYNLRGKTNLGIEALSVEGGYASEQSNDVDANAWYFGAGYQWNAVPLTPSVSYRYSRFSGDDPDSRKSETFDPLFYGPSTTDMAWVQGEIAGTFAGPFNSNVRAQRLTGRVVLSEKVAFSAMAYRFDSERDSEHIADELDLYLQTFPTANLVVMPVLGFWKPHQGAEAMYGTDDVQTFAGLITTLTF